MLKEEEPKTSPKKSLVPQQQVQFFIMRTRTMMRKDEIISLFHGNEPDVSVRQCSESTWMLILHLAAAAARLRRQLMEVTAYYIPKAVRWLCDTRTLRWRTTQKGIRGPRS